MTVWKENVLRIINISYFILMSHKFKKTSFFQVLKFYILSNVPKVPSRIKRTIRYFTHYLKQQAYLNACSCGHYQDHSRPYLHHSRPCSCDLYLDQAASIPECMLLWSLSRPFFFKMKGINSSNMQVWPSWELVLIHYQDCSPDMTLLYQVVWVSGIVHMFSY